MQFDFKMQNVQIPVMRKINVIIYKVTLFQPFLPEANGLMFFQMFSVCIEGWGVEPDLDWIPVHLDLGQAAYPLCTLVYWKWGP